MEIKDYRNGFYVTCDRDEKNALLSLLSKGPEDEEQERDWSSEPPQIRDSIADLVRRRNTIVAKMHRFFDLDIEIEKAFESIKAYSPYRIDRYRNGFCPGELEKHVDQRCWSYLVKYADLKKYMLCTEYERVEKEIEEFKFPEFTLENITAWLEGLKDVIYHNVETLIKQVFEKITQNWYYTGTGRRSRDRKKRNNNGIDEYFIISTHFDYSRVFGYQYRPTITDDLEKVCYIISGYPVPDKTCIDVMHSEKRSEYKNDFFEIKVYKNGNTHYKLNQNIREKLNLLGSGNSTIGENIKIKIFDKMY